MILHKFIILTMKAFQEYIFSDLMKNYAEESILNDFKKK